MFVTKVYDLLVTNLFLNHGIQERAKSQPDQAFRTQLIIAQLYLSQGSVYQACDALKALGDKAHKPGIVSLLNKEQQYLLTVIKQSL